MKIVDMLPQLDAEALATVRANAIRLSQRGTAKQQSQANEALPHIEAEQARRAEAAPPKTKTKSKAVAKPAVAS
jgi:hypothetical protein